MIAHLENDECSAIRDYEFYAHMQHKYVKKEIMKDLETFTENLQINAAFAPQPENPGLIEDPRKPGPFDTETDGGVILDESDEEQKKGHEPLEAKLAAVQLGDQKVALRRSNLEAWPRLPGQAQSVVSSQVLNQSVDSPPPSIVGTDIPASEFASQITSRRGGMKVHTESYPSLQKSTTISTPNYPANTIVDDDDDATSVSTTDRAEAVLPPPAAWTTTATSQALFGNVKATPPPAEIKSILKKREDEANQAPNLLLNARWWDPHSPDYTSDLFLHSVLQKYCCPFPTCDVDPFDHPHDIEGHLLDAHAKTQFRCPGCLKLFKRAQGMVSHMESTSKCPVRRSKDFKSVRIASSDLTHPRNGTLTLLYRCLTTSPVASSRQSVFLSLASTDRTLLWSSLVRLSMASCPRCTRPVGRTRSEVPRVPWPDKIA